MIEVWQALQNADLTEGRGPMVPKVSFLRREDAAAAERLEGVQGVGCGEVAREPLIVYETFGEWPGHTKPPLTERLRERALAKLTREERAALGF